MRPVAERERTMTSLPTGAVARDEPAPDALGELIALAGAICVIVALTLPWYENAAGKLERVGDLRPGGRAADLAAAARSRWCRDRHRALHRAAGGRRGVEHAARAHRGDRGDRACARAPRPRQRCCAPARGSRSSARSLILVGGWQSMRDERTGLYPPDATPPREAPPAGAG